MENYLGDNWLCAILKGCNSLHCKHKSVIVKNDNVFPRWHCRHLLFVGKCEMSSNFSHASMRLWNELLN